MTTIEHVNITSGNLMETLEFLKTALPEWKVRGEGISTATGKEQKWLHFGSDEEYITINEGETKAVASIEGSNGLQHVGFIVEDVDKVARRLIDKGYSPTLPLTDFTARRNVYFMDNSGFEYEFVQYFSKTPQEKNQYEVS